MSYQPETRRIEAQSLTVKRLHEAIYKILVGDTKCWHFTVLQGLTLDDLTDVFGKSVDEEPDSSSPLVEFVVDPDFFSLHEYGTKDECWGGCRKDSKNSTWHLTHCIISLTTPDEQFLATPTTKLQFVTARIGFDLTYCLDLEFAKSPRARRFYEQNRLEELKVEFHCWRQRGRLFLSNETACHLQALMTRVRDVKDDRPTLTGSKRTSEAKRLKITSDFETGRAELVDRIMKEIEFVQHRELSPEDVETHQGHPCVSCHMLCSTLPTYQENYDNSYPIVGDRFYCPRCKVSLCNNCYGCHDRTHDLTLFRVVNPNAVPPRMNYFIHGPALLRQQRASGMFYKVRWAGPWSDTWVASGDLDETDVVEKYEQAQAKFEKTKNPKTKKGTVAI